MMTTTMWHPGARDLLEAAFHSFDQAAQTLQQSYSTLTTRVEQMDLELTHSNDALRQQLRENEAMRMHLDGILESLSTGVLVLDDTGSITRSNRTAGQLLGARLGSRMVVKRGTKFIRPIFITVVLALTGKLLYAAFVK